MARSKDKLIQVEIYGQRYSLKGDDDADVRHVEQLAEHVDRKMREIAQTTPTVDSFRVAVLAAINIADEYFKAKGRVQAIEDFARDKVNELGKVLGDSL